MTRHERWQMAGNAPESYEHHMVPTFFKPWAKELLTRATLQRGERILDVACGTGIVARLAAEQFGSSGYVMGVDLNAGMLEVARAQTPTSGATVEWREGDANALPCADTTFDVVFCQQGFQFFGATAQMFRNRHSLLERLDVCHKPHAADKGGRQA
jgi:ubiquinone/menaquinone biosynthesis C-methylase UbiE